MSKAPVSCVCVLIMHSNRARNQACPWGPHGLVRNAIRNMRGIGRDTFAALGGGENWPKEEREAFDTTLAEGAGKRELAGKLQAMINAAGRGEKTTMAALFGIIYRQEIKAAGGAAGIAKQAGIDNVNVNLGCRLADYVTPNGDVVDAWNNEEQPEPRDEPLSPLGTMRRRRHRPVGRRHQAAGSYDTALPRMSWRPCVWLSPPVVRRFDSAGGPT